MRVKKGAVYILHHPSWAGGADPDRCPCDYDVVTPVWPTLPQTKEDWTDWQGDFRSLITGGVLDNGLRGLDAAWQDKLIPLPPLTSAQWKIPEFNP